MSNLVLSDRTLGALERWRRGQLTDVELREYIDRDNPPNRTVFHGPWSLSKGDYIRDSRGCIVDDRSGSPSQRLAAAAFQLAEFTCRLANADADFHGDDVDLYLEAREFLALLGWRTE